MAWWTAAGGVAEEQHVRVIGHAREDRQSRGELPGLDWYQHQVIAPARARRVDHRHRQLGPLPGLGILQG
jgi:hypothetical protein